MNAFTRVSAAEVSITARHPVREAAERVLGRLWIDQVPVRLASEDPSLWEGIPEGACWPGQPGPARALLPRISELTTRIRARGLTEVVLLGSAVPALAADVVARSERAPLAVLDAPDPDPLFRLGIDHERLLRTVIVLTADDPGTDALRRVFVRMFQGLGLPPEEIAERFVVVAEPDGPLAALAAEAGHPLLTGPAGRVFGALSPQALVPAALAGVDVAKLLDQAAAVLPSLTRPENNPGLVLGALLGGCARAGRDTVVVGSYRSPYEGLGDWIGALLTGATGGALLPLVQSGGVPVPAGDDLFLVALDGRPRQDDATVTGPLGAQLVVWEYSAAVAGYLLGADPLNAPVTADGADALLTDAAEPPPAVRVLGPVGDAVQVRSRDPAFAATEDLPALFDALVAAVPPGGHLAIGAYLDPDTASGQGRSIHRLAAGLATRCGRPVPVTWHSCYPAFPDDRCDKGVYLMLTGEVMQDVPVPDRPHRLSGLRFAQATGAARVLGERGRPVVHLHMRDRRAGLARLLEAARGEA
ncbi:glucose-6-phosphate isomerase [Actinomadura craniellae]|uniref:Glucose-6-phosphate isomerase n=1 Tax=Actinomadura craniellae TaxID=2231787 RepID=A0A365H4I4_9ACTN|nr:glucose-6-phosphate isomerase [Actinomadura craniellae]RAY13902.1 glucose-6-phosphate isomerase [Actinomadura craniellae]